MGKWKNGKKIKQNKMVKREFKKLLGKYNTYKDFLYKENLYNDIESNEVYKNLIVRWLIEYLEERINIFVTLDDCVFNQKGVYMLGDFYIGKTSNLKNRLKYHIIDSIPYHSYYKKNKGKGKAINNILSTNKPIVVKMLSSNPKNEEKLIKEYSNKFQLTNIEFNPNRIYENIEVERRKYTRKQEVFPFVKNFNEFMDLPTNVEYTQEGMRSFMVIDHKRKKYNFYINASAHHTLKSIKNQNASKAIRTHIREFGLYSLEIEYIDVDIDQEIIDEIHEELTKEGGYTVGTRIKNKIGREKKKKLEGIMNKKGYTLF